VEEIDSIQYLCYQ